MSDKPKTFEDYRETGRMVQGWNVGSDEYPSDWKSGEKGWNAGRESRDTEVADLQAKLLEAQAKMVEAFEFIGTRQDVDNGRLSESDCDDLAKILHIADGVTAVPMETADERVTALQAKLLEAEAACAEMRLAIEGIDEWEWHECTDQDRVCPWCGSTERFGHLTECQRQKALAINPGALLLARLKAADELAEASAQILRACASSVPGVFSNAQFILGEKLEAYKAS